MRGRVKRWNDDRGFGFILGDDGQEVFCHVRFLAFGTESLVAAGS